MQAIMQRSLLIQHIFSSFVVAEKAIAVYMKKKSGVRIQNPEVRVYVIV